jgi:hypothetical protein
MYEACSDEAYAGIALAEGQNSVKDIISVEVGIPLAD